MNNTPTSPRRESGRAGLSRRSVLKGLAGLGGSLTLGSALSACAPGMSGGSPEASTSTSQAGTAGTTAREISIVTGENDPATVEVFEGFFEDFAGDHDGWTAGGEFLAYSDALTRITQMSNAGSPPDLAKMGAYDLTEAAARGALEPVTDVVRELGLDQTDRHRLVIDGEDYLVPFDGNVWMMFYRQDLFEEQGLPVPTTFDEYVEASEAIAQVDGMHGNIVGYGPSIYTATTLMNYLWLSDATIFDRVDDSWVVSLDADDNIDKVVDVLEWMKRRADSSPDASAYDWGDIFQTYGTGTIGTCEYSGMRVTNYLREEAPEVFEVTGAARLPQNGAPNTIDAISSWAVFKQEGRDPEPAKQLLVDLVQSDAYLDYLWSVPGHLIPPVPAIRQGAWLDHPLLEDNPMVQVIEDVLPDSYQPALSPSNPTDLNLAAAALLSQPAMPDLVQRVILDNQPPQDAIGVAADEIRAFQQSIEE